jgi:predicted phosphodiesterase
MIALLSDIHANAVALDAVLADMASLEISTALCLGDTVGYGPDPVRCVALVREHCVASVMGNHEAMLFAFSAAPFALLAALAKLASATVPVICHYSVVIGRSEAT